MSILPYASLTCIFQSLTNYAAYLHQLSITLQTIFGKHSLVVFPKCLLAMSNVSVTTRTSIWFGCGDIAEYCDLSFR